MTTLTISPQGEYDCSSFIDDDGETFLVLTLPGNEGRDVPELCFTLASFVTFSDWIAMISEKMMAELPPRRF